MGWVRAIGMSCLVVVASTGAVGAQPLDPPPDPPPASPPPDPPPPIDPVPVTVGAPVAPPAPVVVETTGYPRELVLRPLLLPQGGIEGSALFTMENFNNSGGSSGDTRNRAFIEPRLRYSLGVAEVEAGVSILAYETEIDSMFQIETERFQALFLAGGYKIAPDYVIGGELTVRTPAADSKTYAPRVVAETKLHLSPASAAEIAVKAGVDHTPPLELMGMSYGGGNTFVMSSELRLQAQLAAEVAVEARALLGYYNPPDQEMPVTNTDAFFAQSYGLRLVGSVSKDLDLSAGLDVTYSGEGGTIKLFSVAVAARRVP